VERIQKHPVRRWMAVVGMMVLLQGCGILSGGNRAYITHVPQAKETLQQAGEAEPRALSAQVATVAKAEEPQETGEQVSQIDRAIANEEDGKRYPVSQFALVYSREHPNNPPLRELMDTVIHLGKVSDGYVALREGVAETTWKLSNVPKEVRWFYASAIRAICEQLVAALNERGLMGVYVTVDQVDIEPESNRDLRDKEKTLHLVVWSTIIEEVRTIASGGRVPSEERINSQLHRRIREGSPIKAAKEWDKERNDLLRKDILDDYIYRLNRHPGRRVDVAISSAGEPGEAVLDYLIAENKPWTTYFQLSNTGTKQTNEWRERFGFIHNQLTGRDDILSLDYITAGFDEAHAVIGSYRVPLSWQNCDLRVYGSWNEFTASDVGRATEQFTGDGWVGGGEVIWNIFQDKQLFVDLIAGARWQHIGVQNMTVNAKGDEDFCLPYLGLRLERNTEKSRTEGYLDIEHNVASTAGTDRDEVLKLGRLQTDDEWTALHWSISHSFVLEPLIYGKSWEDVSTPETSTLAHELSFSLSGQYAFGHRLIPQAEKLVGGAYTVRGYPESVAAGDDVYVARAEYRYHVPRAFRPNPNPRETTLFGRPFRIGPQHVFGQPDWDLVLKAFFDYGRAFNNKRLPIENDETLMGAGLGVELQLWRNMHLSCDWGHTLQDLDSGLVEKGEDRLHTGLTVMW